MQCPNCEAENRDDAKFCDECGFPLGGAIARAAAAAPSESASLPAQPAEPWSGGDDSVRVVSASGRIPFEEIDDSFDKLFDSPFGEAPAVETPAPVQEPVLDPGVTRVLDAPAPEPVVETVPGGEAWEVGVEGEPAAVEPEPAAPTDDPFAGFSTQVIEDEFDIFGDAPVPEGYYPPQDAHARGYTMQMPRVEGDEPAASRDFRISSSASKSPSKAVLAIVGVVTVAVIAAVVTFALGLWGGVSVPDVTGMTENDARAVLEEHGFSVRSTQVKSDDTEGLVLVMDPVAGSRAAEGSEIIIHIATARFVPDIVGKSYDDAVKLLNEAGYENVRYEKVKSPDAENVVLSVSPEAGTRAKSSMEIVVGISEAYRVPDISGLSLDAAELAITKGGLVPQVVYVDTQEYPEGTIIGTTPAANTKVSEGDYVSINVARARGAELVSLTEQMLAPGSTVTIGGTSLVVDSVGSIAYQGDDVVSFQVTGRPFATLMGETVYGSSTTVEGQIAWSEDNEVISIS